MTQMAAVPVAVDACNSEAVHCAPLIYSDVLFLLLFPLSRCFCADSDQINTVTFSFCFHWPIFLEITPV